MVEKIFEQQVINRLIEEDDARNINVVWVEPKQVLSVTYTDGFNFRWKSAYKYNSEDNEMDFINTERLS